VVQVRFLTDIFPSCSHWERVALCRTEIRFSQWGRGEKKANENNGNRDAPVAVENIDEFQPDPSKLFGKCESFATNAAGMEPLDIGSHCGNQNETLLRRFAVKGGWRQQECEEAERQQPLGPF
jgi:hypothetical protein